MTTWIDLTDLTAHHGSVGGIERVEYGLIEHYRQQAEQDGEHVGYFRYDDVQRRLVVADFDVVRERVETETQAGSPAPSSNTLRAVGLVRRYLPEAVAENRTLRRSVRGLARRGYHGALATRASARRVVARIGLGDSGDPVEFEADDNVLALGKVWDQPELIHLLTEARRQTPLRLVLLVHDVIPALYPQLHHPAVFVPFTTYLFELVGAADLVLVNSKATEVDLLRFADLAGLRPPTTGRIRLGDELPEVEPARPEGIPDDFLLNVGTIEVRKNHALLYQVYKLAEARGVPLPPLVIVGRPGWHTEDVRTMLARDPAIQGRIIVRSGVTDAELAWLYEHARFAVYPSLYEGWGLPVGEAAALGVATACSNAASIPEIAGPLLQYFSPNSTDECLSTLQAYLEPGVVAGIQDRLRAEYRVTSWSETARQARELILRR